MALFDGGIFDGPELFDTGDGGGDAGGQVRRTFRGPKLENPPLPEGNFLLPQGEIPRIRIEAGHIRLLFPPFIPQMFGHFDYFPNPAFLHLGVLRAGGQAHTRVRGRGRAVLGLESSGAGHIRLHSAGGGRLAVRGGGLAGTALHASGRATLRFRADGWGFHDDLMLHKTRLLQDEWLLGEGDEDRSGLILMATAWSEVHNAADRYTPALERKVKRAFRQGKAALNKDALKAALRDGQQMQTYLLVSEAITVTANSLRDGLDEIYEKVQAASGKAAAKRLQHLTAAGSQRYLADSMAFDVTDPRAVEWIRAHAAETVTGITETTRESIKDLVEAAFEEQYDVDDLADQIEELIGDEDRADAIARTETMKASNAGQQEAWNQAIDAGLLTGDEQQEWIVTPDDRLCPICEPLDGKKAPLGGLFDTELGRIEGPPVHPRCRCTIGLSV